MLVQDSEPYEPEYELDRPLSIAATKREYRRKRLEEKREKRREYWRRVRCWWTWPFRHEFVRYASLNDDGDRTGKFHRACVGCTKTENCN